MIVWKYKLEHRAQSIQMPRGAKVLGVQTQGAWPVMWALVDPNASMEKRRFVLAWTGEEGLNLDIIGYIGTFQAGSLVWHLFEEVQG